jgi:hypothetical protein
MDGSLYYMSSVGAYRVEGISAVSAVTFLGSANNFSGKTSPLAAAGSQLYFSARKNSASEGVLGAYHVDRSVEGYVYADANGNGVRDIGEAGLAGWRVFIDTDGDNIWDANETYIRTNSAGRYAFLDLPTGTIRLCITASAASRGPRRRPTPSPSRPSLQPRRHFGMEPVE